ncbi:PilC/PilY family type IV pilus protein [Ramlibacter sp. AN1015]|uniref:pilus assembly protein n=1 Tax=Ramlibacter sp. AN1015 TaxID=3133428 RepID=UPI0030BB018D
MPPIELRPRRTLLPAIRRQCALWRTPAGTTAALLAAAFTIGQASAGIDIPPTPLSVRTPAKPMVMLVAGKDHRLFYEAYNDASDINGDGKLDLRFNPSTTYLGLFNSNYCYTHTGGGTNADLFSPSSRVVGELGHCTNSWSGNWLNYATTSRIDALRVVLYGGMREVDTLSSTVLRRAYIPQDGHSWAKEYTSESVDGYRIDRYTPLAQPSPNRRHFFGNVTANAAVNCAVITNCSDLPPWLSIVANSNRRVWQWASGEGPVLRDTTHAGTRTNLTVRVLTCANGFTDGCKRYSDQTAKPIGLLHEYGENDAMLFGLLSGSFDRNMAGGRLRKVVSSFANEVDRQSGRFTRINGIVSTYDALRIRDFNNGSRNGWYRGGALTNTAAREGQFPDWGNPVGEMMYEALRYFAGKATPTPDYSGASTLDQSLGISEVPWDDPYATTSAAKAPSCARASLLVVSDSNVSYDSDQVPGSYFNPAFVGDLAGFDAQAEAQRITDWESQVRGARFIGESGKSFDSAPTAKAVESLGTVRGLAPEEPTKQGSYYAASAAAFGKRTDLRDTLPGKQNVETFVVALASPLPRIAVPVPGGGNITVVPFAKTVASLDGHAFTPGKGAFQPTNQIVDFYVEEIANLENEKPNPAINGGRYQAKFRINFEDVEQGADHDMDVVVLYTVKVNADGTVTVEVRPEYQAGGMQHRIGYVISGTTDDGVYLEVQDELPLRTVAPGVKEPVDIPYFLNTPPGRLPGHCDGSPMPEDCGRLPYLGSNGEFGRGNHAVRTFSPRTGLAASFLKDPLWFAAKWGAFVDRNGNGRPDEKAEWDVNGDGMPDAYALVLNPGQLRASLRSTLENIASRVSSASNVGVNSTNISDGSLLFQAQFNSAQWSGDVVASPISKEGLGARAVWRASEALPAWSDRALYMRTTAGTTVLLNQFESLPTADKEALESASVLDWLRGNRKGEVQFGGSLRNRASALGDFVHSSPHYDQAAKVLYVGGNDGMLHAFDGATGAELFGFIPQEVVGRLAGLSRPGYSHEYFVDGDVVVGPRSTRSAGSAYLYALLGRGGRGLFSLDVTRPREFSRAAFRWEYTPSASVAAAKDPHLGHMLGRPLVVALNNNKIGVLAGNGYKSIGGRAVLYIFVVNEDGSLDRVHTLDTGEGNDNGLAGPAVIDQNNDGTADIVYAGDLKGNVWKFDISAREPSAWRVLHGGKPMFRAVDPAGRPQPITAPLTLVRKPVRPGSGDAHDGRLFAIFGTGSYFRAGDPAERSTQTWWGVLADTTIPIPGRNALRKRGIAATGSLRGVAVRVFEAGKDKDMEGTSGWYLDFTGGQPGERIVTQSKIADLPPTMAIVSSLYPVQHDPCIPGGGGFLNVIQAFTGASIEKSAFDVDGDGKVENDHLNSDPIGSADLGIGLPSEVTIVDIEGTRDKLVLVGGTGDLSSGGQSSSAAGTSESASTGFANSKPSSTLSVTAMPNEGKPARTFRGRLSWREVWKE